MREELQSIINFYASNIQNLTSVNFYAFNKEIMRLSRMASGMDNINVTGFQPELNFLNEYLGSLEAPVVLDVGAYRGDYSVGVLKANPDATVYAFEPNPKTFKKLKPLARQLGLIAMNLACSDSEGVLKLYDIAQAERSFRTTAYQDAITEMLDCESICYEVPTITLDHFCEVSGITHIDLLKIDAEGHEVDILDAAKRMLETRSIQAIQFEFNELNVYSGRHFKNFVDRLPDYKFFRILPDGIVPLGDYSPLEHENFVYQNIVALPVWGWVLKES
jgi:FkbM family methyltransferase